MKRILSAILFISIAHPSVVCAGPAQDSVKKQVLPVKKFYVANGIDGLIFSTANVTKSGSDKAVPVRFSAFFHMGFTFNFNLSRHIGVYTGIDVKNVGFIERTNGEVTKRRTYNLGVPIGIRVGNMAKTGKYGFIGGGADVPINYKEKQFVIRNQKTIKFNEWFSDRTPMLMPYLFAGAGISESFTLKFQYYPGNFLNPDFTAGTTKPYAGYDVHLILVSIGYATPSHMLRKKKVK
jgi:hypothetical protein